MLDKFHGLPVHPLLVHAVVVFVPLLILVTLGYALLPRWRSRLDWAVVLLAIAAPISVYLARLSGTRFRDSLFGSGPYPRDITRHQNYAGKLFWFALALGILALLMVALVEGRRRDRLKLHAALPVIVMVLAVASVVPAGIYVYLTGDSGATAVWNPSR
jgi:hypothetical protein